MAAPSRRRLAIDRHVRHQHSEASAEHHRRATVRELRERAQRRPLSRFSCCDGRRVPVLHGSSGSVSGLGWLGPAHLSEDDRSHPTDLLDLLHALGSAARRLRSWAKQVRTLVEPSRGHPPTRQHANTPTRQHVNTPTPLPSPLRVPQTRGPPKPQPRLVRTPGHARATVLCALVRAALQTRGP